MVFPDHPDVTDLWERLRPHISCVQHHASGRPWIVGEWAEKEMSVGAAGDTRLAVLGEHRVSPGRLARLARRVSAPGDLDAFARSEPGSFHLVASVDGLVRVQSPVLRLRRVVRGATPAGQVLAASRADVLAWLLDRDVDPARVALRLLDGGIPYPIDALPLFTGLEIVALGHYLVISPAGAAREVRWWWPPEPSRPLREGALLLRDALVEAVHLRAAHLSNASCDLGGVDSTAVCSLLAGERLPVRAWTVASPDPFDEDLSYAGKTSAALGIEHEVIGAGEMPVVYDGLGDGAPVVDEPSLLMIEESRCHALFAAVASRGSQAHFGGYGGDELLHGEPAWFRHYLRTNPGLAIRNIRGSRANGRWPWRATLRQLLDRRPYGQWLRGFAHALDQGPADEHEPVLDWSYPARFAPWTTAEAVQAARDLVLRAAADAEPLAPSHGMHRELAMMASCSRLLSHQHALAARHDLTLHAVFYDMRVIEAGLSVRPQERISRWQYKPLLAEAMRGTVPEVSLHRATKAEGSAVEYQGIWRNRQALLDYFNRPVLAELGLLDRNRFRDLLERTPPTDPVFATQLGPTVAAEVWLRQHHHSP
ncbi:hypothetical protein GCM10012275_10550 [Longimycelium tulufanense]|uniref:Asparagine synthetase domain-containing protein n=1 Tax=Longimycelium tulufanense TaxID=907463 RepID=A0A8J3C6K5_9PSEU|nr:hypothetical protein GCM10012275_10550 [Longimycelium tulufanense]